MFCTEISGILVYLHVSIFPYFFVLLLVVHVHFRSAEALHLYWFPEPARNVFGFFTEVHKCKIFLVNTNILFLFMCVLYVQVAEDEMGRPCSRNGREEERL
jgi:hypothetical protein